MAAAAGKDWGLALMGRNARLYPVYSHLELTPAPCIRPGGPDRLIAGRSGPNALGGVLRQPQDFQRTGSLLEPPYVAAFFQCRDQAMDARLRPQVQRVLHLIEGGWHASLAHPLMNEHQKLVLLLGQHGTHSPSSANTTLRTTTQHESFYFSSCSKSTA